MIWHAKFKPIDIYEKGIKTQQATKVDKKRRW